jgi:hypothetical protein
MTRATRVVRAAFEPEGTDGVGSPAIVGGKSTPEMREAPAIDGGSFAAGQTGVAQDDGGGLS